MDKKVEIAARGPEELGEAVKRFRKLKELTQAELGEKANLEQKTVSRIEGGKPHLEISSFFAVCAALDLEVVVRPRGGKDKNVKMADIFK